MKPAVCLPAGRLKYLPRWRCRAGFFQDETYEFTVHLLVGIDGPRLMKFCELMYPKGSYDVDDSDDWAGRHAKITFDDKSNHYEVHVVALQEFHWDPHWMSVLGHELLHCVQAALDSRGLQLGDETAEAYCYCFDSLLKRCLQMLVSK